MKFLQAILETREEKENDVIKAKFDKELGLGESEFKPVEMKTNASKQLEVSLVNEAGRSPVFSG
jgi:hypothetical protein